MDVDEEAKTITITDTGIGMTAAELNENLGTIAQSGARALMERIEASQRSEIIGQFGVGFYSAFVVADEVTVISRSYQRDAEAAQWTSSGGETFSVSPAEREQRGTTIILKLKEDAAEFAQEWKLRQVVKRHSDFVAWPIYVGTERANQQTALWRQAPRNVEAAAVRGVLSPADLRLRGAAAAYAPLDRGAGRPALHPVCAGQARARHHGAARRGQDQALLAQGADPGGGQGSAAQLLPLRRGRGRQRGSAAERLARDGPEQRRDHRQAQEDPDRPPDQGAGREGRKRMPSSTRSSGRSSASFSRRALPPTQRRAPNCCRCYASTPPAAKSCRAWPTTKAA